MADKTTSNNSNTRNIDQTINNANPVNSGIFNTGMSGNTGMTGSTGMPGNTGTAGATGIGIAGTGVAGMAGSAGIIDKISMAGTTGASNDTNMEDYTRRGMNVMGMNAGSEEGPTGGISGSDGSGIYGVTERTNGTSDPSNSDVAGGWSLADLKQNEKSSGNANSFQNLSKSK